LSEHANKLMLVTKITQPAHAGASALVGEHANKDPTGTCKSISIGGWTCKQCHAAAPKPSRLMQEHQHCWVNMQNKNQPAHARASALVGEHADNLMLLHLNPAGLCKSISTGG
jgi:hypothetical protein